MYGSTTEAKRSAWCITISEVHLLHEQKNSRKAGSRLLLYGTESVSLWNARHEVTRNFCSKFSSSRCRCGVFPVFPVSLLDVRVTTFFWGYIPRGARGVFCGRKKYYTYVRKMWYDAVRDVVWRFLKSDSYSLTVRVSFIVDEKFRRFLDLRSAFEQLWVYQQRNLPIFSLGAFWWCAEKELSNWFQKYWSIGKNWNFGWNENLYNWTWVWVFVFLFGKNFDQKLTKFINFWQFDMEIEHSQNLFWNKW